MTRIAELLMRRDQDEVISANIGWLTEGEYHTLPEVIAERRTRLGTLIGRQLEQSCFSLEVAINDQEWYSQKWQFQEWVNPKWELRFHLENRTGLLPESLTRCRSFESYRHMWYFFLESLLGCHEGVGAMIDQGQMELTSDRSSSWIKSELQKRGNDQHADHWRVLELRWPHPFHAHRQRVYRSLLDVTPQPITKPVALVVC